MNPEFEDVCCHTINLFRQPGNVKIKILIEKLSPHTDKKKIENSNLIQSHFLYEVITKQFNKEIVEHLISRLNLIGVKNE